MYLQSPSSGRSSLEAVDLSTPETLLSFYQTIRHNIAEDSHPQTGKIIMNAEDCSIGTESNV
jgi:hypothetical protein